MSIIEDGRGSGKKVRVTDTNRLDVSSKSNSRLFYVSKNDEKAFVINLTLTQVLGGATEGLGYVTYIGNNKLYLHSITVATEEPTTGMTKFGIWLEPTTLSGGESKIPTNMNATSAQESETTCIHTNDTLLVTISGGNSLYTIRLNGPNSFIIDFNDAIILGKNQSIGIKTSAATTGTKTRATIEWFEE